MHIPLNPYLYVESHNGNISGKSNWLRAAVLGANDGIVSIAGLVVGISGATSSKLIILAAGIAGIVAGALSMAAGEYVSVSTQRDIEKALLEKERQELINNPEEESEELKLLYQSKGLTEGTALVVAKELTEHDAFAAHVDIELHIDPNNLTNPWHAAYASSASFLVGAIIPLGVIMLPLGSSAVAITFLSVVVALMITGFLSAKVGGSNIRTSMLRVVAGGVLAMIVTYAIGRLFNISGV